MIDPQFKLDEQKIKSNLNIQKNRIVRKMIKLNLSIAQVSEIWDIPQEEVKDIINNKIKM